MILHTIIIRDIESNYRSERMKLSAAVRELNKLKDQLNQIEQIITHTKMQTG